MAWSKSQIILLHRAAKAAGWNDARRYLAMKHAGCPSAAGSSRPSVNHPRNDNRAFERVMELAESCAGQRGEVVPPPAEHRSWREAVRRQGDQLRELARKIVAEAERRLPVRFADAHLLERTISHVCGHDHPSGFGLGLDSRDLGIEHLDPSQLYRVVESLKAHVGRVLVEAGITPSSFEVPAEVRRRLSRREQKRGAA